MEDYSKTKNWIEKITATTEFHIQVAQKVNLDEEGYKFFNIILDICNEITKIVTEKKVKPNYLDYFNSIFASLYQKFPYRLQKNLNFANPPQAQEGIKTQLISNFDLIFDLSEQINFNLDFFHNLDFFDKSIVAIGANGSGKTMLSNHLKAYLNFNGISISAQRVLRIPNFTSISNPKKTLSELTLLQKKDKSYKKENDFSKITQEFEIVLQHLLADNVKQNQEFINKASIEEKNGSIESSIPISNLKKTLAIWNSLIEHRDLFCNDGINIMVSGNSESPYTANAMSDGERVILYLISQVLQAPKNGFIIVDEPELYLHKLIVKKLWDKLEEQRNDH